MELYEIEGFLRGKCLPGDLLVGESNAQYLTRKLNEGAKAKAEVASLSQRVVTMAAESAGLKELIDQHANCFAVCPNCSHEQLSETDDIVALYRSLETPATDASIANIHAQGVDMAITVIKTMMSATAPAHHAIGMLKAQAAQLRKESTHD